MDPHQGEASCLFHLQKFTTRQELLHYVVVSNQVQDHSREAVRCGFSSTMIFTKVVTMFCRVQLLSRQSTSKWLQATRAPKRSETSGPPGAAPRMDGTVIEGLHDIVSVLEDHLKPLVQAEVSVLVDVLYRPELLFPTGPDARRKCEQGGFIRRLITHTTDKDTGRTSCASSSCRRCGR